MDYSAGMTCTVVAFSGSLRKDSFNSALVRAAVKHAPASLRIDVATIAGIPLYDGDREAADGVPAEVTALKDKIAAADGLLIATPEYNNSIPGVLKNAVDWLTRPPADIARVFSGRPVAIMGATLGQGGTLLAQAAWLPILRTLGTLPYFGGRMMVSGAAKVFQNGELADEQIEKQLVKFLTGFGDFVEKHRAPGDRPA
jgi:chromate reductase, NAD(P)H dehydrogenase (quinone)